jgi:membrane-associated phospholipid phosphatase
MSPTAIVISLFCLSAILIFLERRGLPTTLDLSFKGDVKRETRFLAQYGQTVCTVLAALFVWKFDPQHYLRIDRALLIAVLGVAIVGTILKRTLGRARPRRENAGKFLGPSFRHANFRESFPSSHSASAVAFAVVLSAAYPQATGLFWILALICAALRYVMDAHWPSDVLAGIGLGYAAGLLSVRFFL